VVLRLPHRHPFLAIQKPEPTSIGDIGFNKPQVDTFYRNLCSLIDKNCLMTHKMWHVDESAKASSGFQCTGICPFIPDVFDATAR